VNSLVQQVKSLAQAAGEVILPYFSQSVAFDCKADGSPVTLADKAADEFICAGLQRLTPDTPILSEETLIPVSQQERLSWQRLWLVDPLDGTRQFIRGDTGFSVNIALVENHIPVLGVVYSPVDRVGYAAVRGVGAWRWDDDGQYPINVSAVQQSVRVITGFSASKRGVMTQTFLANLPKHTLIELGSAIKICKVAEGSADVYPRFGLTSEWDTAAAQIILEEAGGALINLEGFALRYNERDILENPPFIAVGQLDYPWALDAVNAVMLKN
jgi:3'(2'), 5'-bisphosphate nucleotidase